MAKLPPTAVTAMAITVLVMNLKRRLRLLVLFFAHFTHRYLAKAIARLRSLSGARWWAAMGDRALA